VDLFVAALERAHEVDGVPDALLPFARNLKHKESLSSCKMKKKLENTEQDKAGRKIFQFFYNYSL